MATLAKRNSANDKLILSEGIEDYWFIREEDYEGRLLDQYNDDLARYKDEGYDDLAGCNSDMPCFECPLNDFLCWLWAW